MTDSHHDGHDADDDHTAIDTGSHAHTAVDRGHDGGGGHHAGGDGHSHGVNPDADKRYLSGALALIVAFMIAEVIVGIIAGSLALISDAGHMLTDAASIVLALWAINWQSPETVETRFDVTLLCVVNPWQRSMRGTAHGRRNA
jgi:cobalt-zinc-cadmium efflux system protein